MTQLDFFLKLAFSKENIQNAIGIAVVVGTILNLINQWEPITELQFNQLNYLKTGLTYCVPFTVSVYSAASTLSRLTSGSKSKVNVEVSCRNCGKDEVSLKRGQLIPECKNCGIETQWKLKA